jgi:hypothetical protein
MLRVTLHTLHTLLLQLPLLRLSNQNRKKRSLLLFLNK